MWYETLLQTHARITVADVFIWFICGIEDLEKQSGEILQGQLSGEGQDANSGQAASNPNVIETKVIKGKDNYADSWPSIVKMSNKTEVTGSEKDGNFIYTSPRFEFISDVRLSHSVVNQFSVLFEATAEYMKVLPISSHKAQVTSKRHKIYLFENKETYFKNGGPLGSAGVYIPSKEIIMVPLTSLGVRKAGSGYILDRDKSNKTLPHEIAHIVTDPAYYAHGSIGWFSEGLAEYVGSTPYRGGIYNIRSVQSSLEKYVTEFGKNNTGGRNLGTKINSVNLKDFMLMPYGQFVQNGNKNYGLGALYTYYFFHWDDDGSRDNLTAFLKALKEGKRGEEAIDLLRADRTWEELEEEVASAWRKRGVKITFGE